MSAHPGLLGAESTRYRRIPIRGKFRTRRSPLWFRLLSKTRARNSTGINGTTATSYNPRRDGSSPRRLFRTLQRAGRVGSLFRPHAPAAATPRPRPARAAVLPRAARFSPWQSIAWVMRAPHMSRCPRGTCRQQSRAGETGRPFCIRRTVRNILSRRAANSRASKSDSQ
jgi:hypothetical protein